MEEKKKFIIVKHEGKNNSTFKVTDPKKIAYWKMIATRKGYFIKTTIVEEGEE